MDRDNSGMHSAGYHGNFIPQIPQQMIKRFTKPNGFVVEPYAGYGTTLIECIKSGRNYLGLDINPEAINRCNDVITQSSGVHEGSFVLDIIEQDCLKFDYEDYLVKNMIVDRPSNFDLVILHPPYEGIIKFTDKEEDFSNMSPDRFRENFQLLVNKLTPCISENGFMVLVCSDIYRNSEVLC